MTEVKDWNEERLEFQIGQDSTPDKMRTLVIFGTKLSKVF